VEPLTLSYVASACAGTLQRGTGDAAGLRVCTDSRAAQAGDVFFALKGERFDGHDYLVEVARQGAAALVVGPAPLPADLPPEVNVIQVDDPRQALGRLAARYRQEFTLPVVCVGGSNGKTTTKNLLAALLGQSEISNLKSQIPSPVLASEASFNNDIGVPLTLLRLERHHRAAVLEAGTNHPGELAPLVALIRPRIGVLTSLGREHLEFFGDLAGVAREEGALAEALPPDGLLVLYGDSPFSDEIARRTAARVLRFGFGAANDWRAEAVQVTDTGTTFTLAGAPPHLAGEYRVNLLGRHQAANALAALAVAAELGLDRPALQTGLAACPPAPMRLQLWEAHGVRVLDDAYNANADSVLAALLTLMQLPSPGRRIAVLGDMAELGAQSDAAHAEVGRAAAALGVGQLIAVGASAPVMAAAARAAGLRRVFEFPDVEAAALAIQRFFKPGDLVLLKASRVTRLERLAEVLRAPEKRRQECYSA
jgi:UDP-N-acetylmuramoyl-tripeptide--D-alanyl-D-alanine ligase